MATYNGARFIHKQLNSIISQSYTSWELIIRDDNSDDETVNIINAFVKNDDRIKLISSTEGLHGSACKNFSALFDWAVQNNKQCIMFSDQDDIWENNKIERTLFELEKQESDLPEHTAVLIYTNFKYIDEKDQVINKKIPLPSSLELRVLLNENHAWGCTMLLNRALIKKIGYIPPHVVNHDYWVALVASCSGRNYFINEPLIRYRQHNVNVSGNVSNMSFTSRFNRYIKKPFYLLPMLKSNFLIIYEFYQRYNDKIGLPEVRLLKGFIDSYQEKGLNLFIYMLKNRVRKVGLFQNLAYFYTLAFLRSHVMNDLKKDNLIG